MWPARASCPACLAARALAPSGRPLPPDAGARRRQAALGWARAPARPAAARPARPPGARPPRHPPRLPRVLLRPLSARRPVAPLTAAGALTLFWCWEGAPRKCQAGQGSDGLSRSQQVPSRSAHGVSCLHAPLFQPTVPAAHACTRIALRDKAAQHAGRASPAPGRDGRMPACPQARRLAQAAPRRAPRRSRRRRRRRCRRRRRQRRRGAPGRRRGPARAAA